MTASPDRQELHPQALTERLIGLLRCPVCKGSLSVVKDVSPQRRISCLQCARCYPVVDGLPVLIPERASFGPASAPDPSPTGDTASH